MGDYVDNGDNADNADNWTTVTKLRRRKGDDDILLQMLDIGCGSDYWGGSSSSAQSSSQHSFSVRAVGVRNQAPKRISDCNVSVVASQAGEQLRVNADDNGDHYRVSFQPQLGPCTVAVNRSGIKVLERVLNFTDSDEPLVWFSQRKDLDCLPAAGIAEAHLCHGRNKKGYGNLQKFR